MDAFNLQHQFNQIHRVQDSQLNPRKNLQATQNAIQPKSNKAHLPLTSRGAEQELQNNPSQGRSSTNQDLLNFKTAVFHSNMTNAEQTNENGKTLSHPVKNQPRCSLMACCGSSQKLKRADHLVYLAVDSNISLHS